MKLLAEPESMRALTETGTLEAVRQTIVVSGVELIWGLWTTLPMGQGQMGHGEIICPLAPQYKQRPWVSPLCRSVVVSRAELICMGSDAGSGELTYSGWQGGNEDCWPSLCSIHPCTQWATRLDSWINFLRLMTKSYAARCSRKLDSDPCRLVVRSEWSFQIRFKVLCNRIIINLDLI